MEKTKKITKEETIGARDYAGVAINIADNDKVSEKLVKDRVKVENNNPRNND